MSIKINIDNLNNEQRDKINDELRINLGTGLSKYIFPYNIENDDIYIPFAFAMNEMHLKRNDRKNYPSMNVNFEGSLRDEQKEVKKEAIDILNKNGSVILSMYTGCGKTITSINIACTIKLKTLIIVNKIVLLKQWKDSILNFCPASKIQELNTKSKFDEDSDFFIMNAINVPKMKNNFFKAIGTCIIDECHLIMAESLSKSLLTICPRYLIGLSATPYREDGLDKLLEFYFGNIKIIREMFRKHIVYKVSSNLDIPIETTDNGRVNWNAVLKKQTECKERNELIIKIVKKYKDKNFLVLSKRVDQATYLFNRLKEDGEYVTSLIGKQQTFDKEARILVGITTKCGTGFDHPKLNALILASDLDSYFIQALGRIFRVKDTIPIVFDIVDNNFILQKHYKNRLETYRTTGGKIINFEKEYPEF
jgi:superfamily II DNA or RNA helicase